MGGLRISSKFWCVIYASFLPFFAKMFAQEVNDVLVIVSRYWGGIHLGPDRFKHINQAARNALDLGGFLDAPEGNSSGKRHTGRKKR